MSSARKWHGTCCTTISMLDSARSMIALDRTILRRASIVFQSVRLRPILCPGKIWACRHWRWAVCWPMIHSVVLWLTYELACSVCPSEDPKERFLLWLVRHRPGVHEPRSSAADWLEFCGHHHHGPGTRRMAPVGSSRPIARAQCPWFSARSCSGLRQP